MSLKSGRTVKDAEDARACLAAAASTGMTLYGWCSANNVASSGLYQWRKRLAARPGGEPRFVEVTAAAPTAPAAVTEVRIAPPVASSADRTIYEVHLGDCRVVVGDDFRDETLARLLRVARAC